jgi:hypothetical protein
MTLNDPCRESPFMERVETEADTCTVSCWTECASHCHRETASEIGEPGAAVADSFLEQFATFGVKLLNSR